jgi:nucleotide-binding universal stress UspA family protein
MHWRCDVKRILVPLDGSGLSEAVLPLAEALARDYEASLLLVRALRPAGSPETEVEAQETAETYLRTVAAGLTGRGRSVDWKVWYDDPARAIADAARYNAIDLVVMSTHGRGGLSRLMLGSVAEALVRQAPVPVLLVRGELIWRPGSFGKILVPLDGSELSEGVLPVAVGLAGPFDLAVELFRAVEPMPAYAAAELSAGRTDAILREEEASAREYLAKLATPLEARGLRIERSVATTPAVDGIVRRARDGGAGLIAMTTHGRSGVSRLLFGSVAERVLRAAPVPVLLWKAPAESRSTRAGGQS